MILLKTDLADWANYATIIEAGVVILSVVFIWLQIKQQTQLTKIARTQELVSLSSPFNLELIKDKNMADFWVNGSKKYGEYDEVEKYQYKSMLIWWLIFHENIFYQNKQGLLDEAIYKSWEYDLEHFVKRQMLESRWNDSKDGLKNAFQEEFRNHVTNLIAKASATATDTK